MKTVDDVLTELVDLLIDKENKQNAFEQFDRIFRKTGVYWKITITKRRKK